MAASKPIRPRPSREKIVSIIRDPVKKTPIKNSERAITTPAFKSGPKPQLKHVSPSSKMHKN